MISFHMWCGLQIRIFDKNRDTEENTEGECDYEGEKDYVK